jgi:hypothetical protein
MVKIERTSYITQGIAAEYSASKKENIGPPFTRATLNIALLYERLYFGNERWRWMTGPVTKRNFEVRHKIARNELTFKQNRHGGSS